MRLLILFFIFAALIFSGCITGLAEKTGRLEAMLTPANYAAENGDSVEVDYAYENNSGSTVVVIGEGRFPEKIESALIGMKEGEDAEIFITPEDGYGHRDEARVSAVPRVTYYPKRDVMPLELFTAMFVSEPVINASYSLGYWNMSVEVVDKENVTVKNNAKNEKIEEPWGEVIITVNETHIRKELMPAVNASMHTILGHAWIASFNDSHIILDYNHPLAGKSVIFKIKIKTITKKSQRLGETRKYGEVEFYSFEKGAAEAERYNKALLVYFRSDSCYWCKKFEEEVLTDKTVAGEIRKSFIPVAVDVYAERKFAAKYNVLGTPTIVFTDSSGNELKKIIGFRNDKEFLEELGKIEVKNAKI